MWTLIAAVALAVAAPADVTATKLDGTTIVGKLKTWASGAIVLDTADGPKSIPTAEVVSLELSASAASDMGQPQIELVDGSLLPLAHYATGGKQAEVRLKQPSVAESQALSVPLERVRAVRLQPLATDVIPQWREVRQLDTPSDLLVVAKRGGKSLDHLECILGNVTDKEVEIEVDGKTVQVPREKVAGLVYYRPGDKGAESPPCILAGKEGLRIAAHEVRWQGDVLSITTPTELELTWPLADIDSADLSVGKLLFLSEAEPAAASWQPLIGLPADASLAAKFGQPHFNRSAEGGPLTLAYPDKDPAVGTREIKNFNKGMALRSRSELVYRLPRGYRRFLAEAGIEPAVAQNGSVVLSVYGDDQLLAEQAIKGTDAPLLIDVDIAGVRRLKIVVDYGRNLDTGDWLNLCNARIVK